MQKASPSPLAAGYATQVAEVRYSKADLAYSPGPSILVTAVSENSEQPLFPLERSHLGPYPGMWDNPHEVLQYSSNSQRASPFHPFLSGPSTSIVRPGSLFTDSPIPHPPRQNALRHRFGDQLVSAWRIVPSGHEKPEQGCPTRCPDELVLGSDDFVIRLDSGQ